MAYVSSLFYREYGLAGKAQVCRAMAATPFLEGQSQNPKFLGVLVGVARRAYQNTPFNSGEGRNRELAIALGCPQKDNPASKLHRV
jgi:hypothetical protein